MILMSTYAYRGGELDLFARARNWKAYVRSKLAQFLVGDVLEVGAGIGATTQWLCDGRQRHWTALEPDPRQAARIVERIAQQPFAAPVDVVVGMIADLETQRVFDAILYIDVLEHIEADAEELRRATGHLKPDGVLVVLAPAYQWLYSAFDRAIGHYRRYTARTLAMAAPDTLSLETLLYLDAVGLLVSLGNRLFLRRSLPNAAQIWVWDRVCVPCSRRVDALLGYRVGKTVLGVWRKS